MHVTAFKSHSASGFQIDGLFNYDLKILILFYTHLFMHVFTDKTFRKSKREGTWS